MSGVREEVDHAAADGALVQDNNETEGRARRMGWVPRDEFRGDPSRWTSAEDYVRMAEERMPVLLERNRTLDRRAEEADKNTRAVLQIVAEMRESAAKNEKRAYDRALADLRAQAKQAVASADTATYEQTQAQIDELEKQKPAPPAPVQPAPLQVPEEVRAFVARSPWFQTNEAAKALAVAEHERLLRTAPGMAMNDNLAQVEARVRRAFPEEFPAPRQEQQEQNARREQPAAVGGSNAAPSRNTGGPSKKIADLQISADEKAECRRALAKWQKQMPDFTEEEYVRSYV